MIPKICRIVKTKITCVTKVGEMHMWHRSVEHNYLEKEEIPHQ
jgi:hypothetical protein